MVIYMANVIVSLICFVIAISVAVGIVLLVLVLSNKNKAKINSNIKYCLNCGFAVQNDEAFCKHCGKKQ